MSQKLCLHLGNGTVYLDSNENEKWLNIDFVGPLAKDCPDIVEHNKTDVEHYYKYQFRENKGNNVTDMIMDVTKLSYFEDDSVDKILCVNIVDHFKKHDFMETIREWHRVLRNGGELIIDVDDRKKQAKMLVDAKTIEEEEWALRLIYCDSVEEGRTHFFGYTEDTLRKILNDNGFLISWVKDDYITHSKYPNFQICGVKYPKVFDKIGNKTSFYA